MIKSETVVFDVVDRVVLLSVVEVRTDIIGQLALVFLLVFVSDLS